MIEKVWSSLFWAGQKDCFEIVYLEFIPKNEHHRDLFLFIILYTPHLLKGKTPPAKPAMLSVFLLSDYLTTFLQFVHYLFL
jgi:hypothetical protein